MRFLHTADVHIGAKFEMLGNAASEQRQQIKKTFSRIIDTCLDRDVDLLLIAGDLFDSNHPSAADVDFVRRELNRLAEKDIQAVLIPGNHDYVLSDPEGLAKEFSGMDHVTVFTKESDEKVVFEDLNTEIYAKANTTNTSAESPMVRAEADVDAFQIVMAHGGVVGQARKPQWPITGDHIAQSNADYVALGDWHSLREESQGGVTAYYPGAPEAISLNQTGSGSILLGEYDEQTQQLQIEPVRISTRTTEAMEIDISQVNSTEELHKQVADKADEQLGLTVTITGLNTNKVLFNKEELEEGLADSFWRLRVIDETVLPVEDIGEKDYSSVLVTGQFVRILKDKIENARDEEEKALYQEALQLGLRAFENPDIIK